LSTKARKLPSRVWKRVGVTVRSVLPRELVGSPVKVAVMVWWPSLPVA